EQPGAGRPGEVGELRHRHRPVQCRVPQVLQPDPALQARGDAVLLRCPSWPTGHADASVATEHQAGGGAGAVATGPTARLTAQLPSRVHTTTSAAWPLACAASPAGSANGCLTIAASPAGSS